MYERRIAVIGAGYVGLTAAACLASLGHTVVCADTDQARVEALNNGKVPMFEPAVEDLVVEGLGSDRLRFVSHCTAAIRVPDTRRSDARRGEPVEFVFLCVPTPMGDEGEPDLTAVTRVLEDLREVLPRGCVVVNKSTVPVGTAAWMTAFLGRDDVAVVSNPEFLREGSAVVDFLNPDRIVVGCDRSDAGEMVAALYSKLGARTLLIATASAELLKYAANCFLAMKLSYVNALAELCERLDVDLSEVTEGMGDDQRIGRAFLRPGPGWGGSCLPKDTHALIRTAEDVGFDFALLRAALQTNQRQAGRVVEKVRTACRGSLAGTRVGLLGLTFKAGTDDLRDSPALIIAAALADDGADLVAFDPCRPPNVGGALDGLTLVDEAIEAARDVDALVLLTEWPEFRSLDWAAMGTVARQRVIIDTRNHLDPSVVEAAGFRWIGAGRC